MSANDDDDDGILFDYLFEEESTSTPTKANTAANAAENLRLAVLSKPYDLDQPVEREALLAELTAGDGSVEPVLPDDNGVYYLFWMRAADGSEFPLLWPEASVPALAMGMAAMDSLTAAQTLQYRKGTLPLHGPESQQ